MALLVQGTDRALYGTTAVGGNDNAGTVFGLNPDGSGYRILFTNQALNGGVSVVQGSDGALYGTTEYAGSYQWGTAFKLNRDGSGYMLLHTFGGPGDGGGPMALIEAGDGALYGTTLAAGSNGYGAVFRLDKDGSNYRLLHSFGGSGDGKWPYAGVVEGNDGALYGTTHEGGATNAGTVFRLNKDGSAYSILHNFGLEGDPTLEGKNPTGPVMEGSDGALYGTAYAGGGLDKGTVFTINRDGSGYRGVQSFGGSIFNHLGGAFPWGGLVEGSDGALYGTTLYGGTNATGTVFRLTKDGTETETLYNFGTPQGTDGQNPRAGLTRGNDGVLYGTTQKGGPSGAGVLFRLLPPETPDILGVALVGRTAEVSFAGISGYNYQVLRSTNLTDWTLLNTVTMPSAGVYTSLDNSPPNPTAYYRVSWTP